MATELQKATAAMEALKDGTVNITNRNIILDAFLAQAEPKVIEAINPAGAGAFTVAEKAFLFNRTMLRAIRDKVGKNRVDGNVAAPLDPAVAAGEDVP